MVPAPKYNSQPPKSSAYLLTVPTPHVLLITINRPNAMNSLGTVAHWEGAELFDWFDSEPSLRAAVVTGAGDKAFCAGQDLIEAGKLRR